MFDRIVLINLDKRQDRLGAFKAKISPYPSLHKYIRYRAVHGDTVTVPGFFISGGGAWGCRQSHLRVLEDAMLDGVETLLVLEDDVRFVPNFEAKLKAFLNRVPDDWEGLMLGGQNHGPDPTATGIEGIVRSINTQRTHAYVVRGLDPMRDLYKLWSRCDRHIDHWFGQWQQRHQVYQPEQFLCGQDETNSDISGRSDQVRYWDKPIADTKNYPITVLIAERVIAETIRNLGFHFGYDRDKLTGKDTGLTVLEAAGWPADKVEHWGNIIVQEALERGDTPGMWHVPTPDSKFLESRFRRPVSIIEARTVDEAVSKIPKLIPAWKASKIIWCWRGEGFEILEGLAYHGWHRGYWKDDITGLDQGMRHMVDSGKYHLVKQIVRQLSREIINIRYGKILLAHPHLDIELIRKELPDHEIREITGNSIQDVMSSSDKILGECVEMYVEEGH